MISKEEAKAILAKFYLDELTNEESMALTDFAKRTSFQGLLDEVKEDPKYKDLMAYKDLVMKSWFEMRYNRRYN